MPLKRKLLVSIQVIRKCIMKDHFGEQKYMNEPSTCNNLRGKIYFANDI